MKEKANTVIANNVKTYRETAGYSQEVLAFKSYMPLNILEKIENGIFFENEFYYLMKIAETLGVTYYDLFERKDGGTSRNIFIPQEAVNKIFASMEKKGITQEAFCKAIGTKHNSVWYWKSNKCIPSPLLFHNAVTYLGLHADSFKDIVKSKETKEVQVHMRGWIDERQREKPVDLGEVIKACNVFQKLDSVINQLDAIIKTATDLKAELEKERA